MRMYAYRDLDNAMMTSSPVAVAVLLSYIVHVLLLSRTELVRRTCTVQYSYVMVMMVKL